MDKLLNAFSENFSLIITIGGFIAHIYYGLAALTKRVDKLEERWDKHLEKNDENIKDIAKNFHKIELNLQEINSKTK